MRVKLLHDWEDEKGRTAKAGTHIDVAYRYAKKLIKQGIAIGDKEEVEPIAYYSKDNPPPDVQEVEIKEEQIFKLPEAEPQKVTWWDKLKSLWQRLA